MKIGLSLNLFRKLSEAFPDLIQTGTLRIKKTEETVKTLRNREITKEISRFKIDRTHLLLVDNHGHRPE